MDIFSKKKTQPNHSPPEDLYPLLLNLIAHQNPTHNTWTIANLLTAFSSPHQKFSQQIEHLFQSAYSAVLPLPMHGLKTPVNLQTKRPCVLFMNGTYSPAHPGHIDTMIQAKIFLETEGFEVLGGYFSPSSQDYAFRKLGSRAVPLRQRLKVLDLLIEESGQNWIMVDYNEAFYRESRVNPMLMRELIETRLIESGLEWYSENQFDVFWVKGVDSGYFPSVKNIIVDNRGDYKKQSHHFEKVAAQQKASPNRECFFVKTEPLHISSTKIRNEPEEAKVFYSQFPKTLAYLVEAGVFPKNIPNRTLDCSLETLLYQFDFEQVAPEDLEMILRATTFIQLDDDEHVVSSKRKRIGVGLGFRAGLYSIGNITTTKKEYPGSFIWKFPVRSSPVKTSNRMTNLARQRDWELTERERMFYENIAPHVKSVRFPEMYGIFREETDQSRKVLFLMEHLDASVFYGFGEEGIPNMKILIAMERLAEFHCQFTSINLENDPRTKWIPRLDSPEEIKDQLIRWEFFWVSNSNALRKSLNPSFAMFLEDYKTTIPELLVKLCKSPLFTIVHRDLWINNFGFVENPNATPFDSPYGITLFDRENSYFQSIPKSHSQEIDTHINHTEKDNKLNNNNSIDNNQSNNNKSNNNNQSNNNNKSDNNNKSNFNNNEKKLNNSNKPNQDQRSNQGIDSLVSKSKTELLLIDWQTICLGNPVLDVVSILDTTCKTGGLQEGLFLHAYYDSLIRCGMNERLYTYSRFMEDVFLAKQWNFINHFPILGHAFLMKALPEEQIKDIAARGPKN